MLDIMVDLETMDRRPTAAIIAIGAVEFNIATGKKGEVFYRTVNLDSSVAAGCTLGADTIVWWMKQGDTARQALTRNAQPLAQVLDDFSAWLAGCGTTNDLRMWGNGPSFDNAILGNAYRAVSIEQPWPYWGDRCFRTAAAMYATIEKRKRDGTHHNALDDAIYQADHLIHIAETLRARRPATAA